MAVRYGANLIRTQTTRVRARRGLLKVFGMCLAFLALMLVCTYAIYLQRNQQIVNFNTNAEQAVSRMAELGVKKAEVDQLHKENDDLTAAVNAVAKLTETSASWPAVMLALQKCCKPTEVKLRKVEADQKAPVPSFRVEGEVTTPNPVSNIRDFLKKVSSDGNFGEAGLVSINRRGETGPVIFEALVPLRTAASLVQGAPAASQGALTDSSRGVKQ